MTRLRKLIYGFVFIVPVTGIMFFLDRFIYLRGSIFSDLTITHLPNLLWIQRAWQEWKQIPLWSNTILSGYPFAADPLSGLHYPPGWLAFPFPQPFGLNLVVLIHMIFGGIGMYRLIRKEGLGTTAAVLGVIGFESMPKLIAHMGAGHVTLVYAVSWTPWLLLAETSRKRWLPAVVLGLIVLADLRWAGLVSLLWLAYSMRNSLRERGSTGKAWVGRWAISALGSLVAASLLSAVLLLPLGEYTSLSTRTAMTAADVNALSLPPAQLLGFLAPLSSGQEWVIYPGAAILALALTGLGSSHLRKEAGFWYWVFCASLLYAMIGYLPGGQFVAEIPGLNLLRVPTRGMFAGEIALIMAASHTLQGILNEGLPIQKKNILSPSLILVSLDFLAFLLAGAGWAVTGKFQWQFTWGAVALAGCLVFLSFSQYRRIRSEGFAIVLILWLLVDLYGSNLLNLEFYPANVILNEKSPAALALTKLQNGQLIRVYSPSYSLPQQTAVRYHLELADGVDPLQLSRYTGYMRQATGVKSEGYSVTLPAFVNGEPKSDNRNALPDARLLGYLNIGYVVSEFPLNVKGLTEIERVDETIIYQNSFSYPRAWVQNQGSPPDVDQIQAVEIHWTPNRIDLSVKGSGRLVLDELVYPGWTVFLDGKQVPLLTEKILRAVDLPEGDHAVSFVYIPGMLIAGGIVSGLSWLGILVLWISSRLRQP
jgi:hypothetical protein